MIAAVQPEGLVRDFLRGVLEAIVPWFDPAEEAARRERSEALLAESRRVRANATRALRESRNTRRQKASDGYRAYGERAR